jgi:hypothetical protein
MDADHGHVMLVGSVARPDDGLDAEGALSLCGHALGSHVSKLPDGEVGDRYYWINFLARHPYNSHRDLVTISRHTFDDWLPTGYADHWKFTVADGVTELRFESLGYAAAAQRSYAAFKRLRDSGEIAEDVRFMVALPLIESGTRPFIDTAQHWEVLWAGYAEAMARELDELCAAIPREDLAIQWDVCLETAAVEGVQVSFDDVGLTTLPRSPRERLELALSTLCPHIPEPIWLGLHICYGSLGHEEGASADSGHFKEIQDLGVSVDMANRGAAAAGRSVQFVHMAVQHSRGFLDEYYRPLRHLDVGDARVYLGLLHLQDGVEGAQRRTEIARRYLPQFGAATQCGWGRRPASESLDALLTLHIEAADRVFAESAT